MGYTTDFEGEFKLDKPLTEAHRKYLSAFAETRRMQRDEKKTSCFPDPVRAAVGLPIGRQGGYFVGASENGEDDVWTCHGQERTSDITDYNRPPSGQPGLWCQWVPNEEGTTLEWGGGEKFYDYVDWIIYLIENFIEPWGYTLNGEVEWEGEENDDIGKIVVVNNSVSTKTGKITYN